MSEHVGINGQEYDYTLLTRSSRLASAQFVISSSRLEEVDNTDDEVLKTKVEQLQELWEAVQSRYWFMQPEYRTREPHEQWNISIGNRDIPVYNYSDNVELLKGHLQAMALSIRQFSSRFSEFFPTLKAITIVDHLPKNAFNDEDDLTIDGEAQIEAGMFALSPKSFNHEVSGIIDTEELELNVIHELAHFGMSEALVPSWRNLGLSWEAESEDNGFVRYRSNSPERCATRYAIIAGEEEDIADSLGAHILDKPLDPAKKEVFYAHESWLSIPGFSVEKQQRIIMPSLPGELKYFLDHDTIEELEVL